MPVVQVKQIDHVTLVVKDLERSRRFYEEVLGMQLVPRPNFPFDGLWFQAGATQIHLILEHEASGPAGERKFPNNPTSRGRHFAFEVNDAQAATEQLRAHGITLAAGPKHRPDGPLQICILDPDDHLVELFSLV